MYESRTDPSLDSALIRPINRRAMLKAMAGAVGAAALVACGVRSPSPGSGSVPVTAPASISAKRKTLRIWDADPADYGNAQVMQTKVWEPFKDKFPDMKLEYTAGLDPVEIGRKFVQANEVGQAPDLFYNYASKGQLWLGGFLHPVDDLLEELGISADFYENAKEIWRFDGKLYGIPTFYGTKCYLYRKDLLEKVGRDPNKVATNWDEFAEMAGGLAVRDQSGKFIQDGYVYWATSDKAASSEQLVVHMFQNWGTEFVENEVTGKSGLTSPESREAFTWFMDLIRARNCQSKDGPIAPEEPSELGAGLSPIAHEGPWQVPKLEKAYPGVTEKLIVGPPLMRKERVGLGNANAWSINAKSDLLEETLELAKIFLQDDLYMAYHASVGDTTARKSINASPSFWMANNPLLQGGAFIDAFEQGRDVGNKHVGYSEIYSSVYGRMIEQGLFQTADDETILKDAAAEIDKITETALRELGL